MALGKLSYIPTLRGYTHIHVIQMMIKCFSLKSNILQYYHTNYIFAEPVGLKAPAFSTTLKSISIEQHLGQAFAMLSNAQGYPVPSIRDVLVFISLIRSMYRKGGKPYIPTLRANTHTHEKYTIRKSHPAMLIHCTIVRIKFFQSRLVQRRQPFPPNQRAIHLLEQLDIVLHCSQMLRDFQYH